MHLTAWWKEQHVWAGRGETVCDFVTVFVDSPRAAILCHLRAFQVWAPYFSPSSSRINMVRHSPHFHTTKTRALYLWSTHELPPKCRSQESRKYIPRPSGKIWLRMWERGQGKMNTPQILIYIKLQKNKQSSLIFPPRSLCTNDLTASFHFFASAPRHL